MVKFTSADINGKFSTIFLCVLFLDWKQKFKKNKKFIKMLCFWGFFLEFLYGKFYG